MASGIYLNESVWRSPLVGTLYRECASTLYRVDNPANKMNLHQIRTFTQNFSIKFTCCVPEPVMMLYVL